MDLILEREHDPGERARLALGELSRAMEAALQAQQLASMADEAFGRSLEVRRRQRTVRRLREAKLGIDAAIISATGPTESR